jgi:hypothetical protein
MRQELLTQERSAPKRRPNRDERRALQGAELASFVTQYGRRAQRGVEPNDRRFDQDTVRRVRRMNPSELDRLMRDDEE